LRPYLRIILSFITGKTIVQSKITLSKKAFSFAVLYLGQQNIIGNISTDLTEVQFLEAQKALKQEFLTTDLGRVIGSMQSYFKSDKFSIWHLFRDEKRFTSIFRAAYFKN